VKIAFASENRRFPCVKSYYPNRPQNPFLYLWRNERRRADCLGVADFTTTSRVNLAFVEKPQELQSRKLKAMKNG